MGDDDLRAAIEGPARQAGLLLEPGLVDLLVSEVEGEPGALPLLSHALRRTWHEREGRTLTVAGYRKTGGIRGAVAQSAEEVYERLPAEQRPLLRDLLLRLVTPSPNGEPVRTRVPRRTVAADADHEGLIEQLVAARLVTSDGDVVELAHESLARAWPRLRGWLDDDVDGQRILRHLAGAADTWDTMGRPDSELYRGLRLAQAVDWRDRRLPDLDPVRGGVPRRRTALAEAEERSAEDERGARSASTGGSGCSSPGWHPARRRHRRRTAGRAPGRPGRPRRGRRRRRAGGGARRTTSPRRSLAPPRGRGGTPRRLTRHQGEPAGRAGEEAGPDRIDPDPKSPASVDVNPASGRVAVGGPMTSLYDAGTLGPLASADLATRQLAFRPDGRQLAIANGDLLDPRRGPAGRRRHVQGTAGPARRRSRTFIGGRDLDYSADGRSLAGLFDAPRPRTTTRSAGRGGVGCWPLQNSRSDASKPSTPGPRR